MTQFPTSHFISSRRPTGNWQRNQNTVSYTSLVKLGPVSHTVLVALMVAVLGLIYLMQVSQTGAYGYELQKVSDQKIALESKKSDLESENARLQSLRRISDSAQVKTMTAPTETAFVQ